MDYDKEKYELRIIGETDFEKEFLARLEITECKKVTMMDGKEKQIVVEAQKKV